MEYHEVRIVAELRKQGEHERAEEFRLKAMRRTPRRIPEHWCPWLAPGLPTPAGRRPVRRLSAAITKCSQGSSDVSACRRRAYSGNPLAQALHS
jgi:hypothetical protein